MSMQKVSCITVCRNSLAGLKKTIESALTQPLFEIVIVDGASSDGTPEELTEIKKRCEIAGINCVAVSEPDTGIYNAMNKGIGLASGEWLVFMNAGDMFSGTDVLSAVFAGRTLTGVDVIYCDYFLSKNGKLIDKKALGTDKITKGPISCHQAILTRRERLVQREYQERFRICADYEWYLNLYLEGGNFEYVPVKLCIYDGGGVSMLDTTGTYREVSKMRREKGVGDPALITAMKLPLIWFYGIILRRISGR